MGGSVTLHFPLESVFVFSAVFPKVTVISLLGAAVPETGMFFPWGTENPVEPGGVRPRCVKGDGGSQDA